jgi:periplasmic divalent cation tolerance protein
MQPTDYSVVFITVNDNEEAENITRLLLEKRQATCINIIAGVDSRFWWQNKLESARESLLVVKTKASLLPDIIRSVKKNHSNEVPEVIAMPIVGGNKDYLDWIDSEAK